MSLEDQIGQTVDPALFTRLCNAVLTAEHPHDYQVVDGTRGDGGNDGWLRSQKRMYAMYCPVKPEHRTDKEITKKALSDLGKAAELRAGGKYDVQQWTFVTPRKLSNDVLIEIFEAGVDLDIEVDHVESTYLAGLLLKHKHLLTEFPQLYVSQLEEFVKQALDTPEAKNPKPSAVPEHDIFSWLEVKKAAAKDESLKEVIALREMADGAAAKRGLRALFYTSTNPLAQVNAVAGLMDRFDPMEDDLLDLAGLCDAALVPAKVLGSKSAEAYLLAQRGYYQSFVFGRLLIERFAHVMMEQRLGMSLEDPAQAAQRQKRLNELMKAFTDAFTRALQLAHESGSGSAMAAILISIGNAAGQRALALKQTGPKESYEHERGACKRALLGAKDIYAQLGSEHEVGNALMNLANQIRFLDEVDEAKELVKVVIPIAEKHQDDDLLMKARLLEERLRTGKIPNYVNGEKSGLRRG